MKKTIGLIVMLLVTLVMLTGCVNINYEVKVNKNGSGEVSYLYGFSKETLESLGVTTEDMVSSMKDQADENGYTTEYYEDDKISGFKASKHLDNLLEEFSLQEAFGEDYVKEDEDSDYGIHIKNNLFKTEISQKAEIDLTEMEDIASVVTMKYTVKLPVKSNSNNATEITQKGKALTWNLIGGEVNNIEFTAEGVNVLSVVIITILVLAIIVAVLVYVFVFSKKKKETK